MARPDKSRPGGMFVVYFIKYSWPLSFTVPQFPAMTPLPGPDIKSVLERERNVEMLKLLDVVWGRWGDAGKVEMKRVDLPRAVHLTTTAPPSPSAATTHHFNFQLLTVFTSFSRKMKRMFENSHEHHDIDLGGWMVGEDLFCWMRVMFE